jgi:hypothetical protein
VQVIAGRMQFKKKKEKKMYLNKEFRSRSYYVEREVWRLQSLIETLKEISEKTENLSKQAKDLLNLSSVSIKTREKIDEIIKEQGWVIELSQTTNKGSGDAREHCWLVESLEDIHHQRFYTDYSGNIPEVFITVKNFLDGGQVIFSMSLDELHHYL